MAVSWTNITNAQVAAGAALTTALVTALRDNPEGIAQRAPGAPKIFGCPYDYQRFTANGTWFKPAAAQTGDKVLVYVLGGGAAGAAGSAGGDGGRGARQLFAIDDLPSSTPVIVGAGGATNSANGGYSEFGSSGDLWFIRAEGGKQGAAEYVFRRSTTGQLTALAEHCAGDGAYTTGSLVAGGVSQWAGHGGDAQNTSPAFADPGAFPGGGGGANTVQFGAGANGIVEVWCWREEA